jgi:hypothetical protein
MHNQHVKSINVTLNTYSTDISVFKSKWHDFPTTIHPHPHPGWVYKCTLLKINGGEIFICSYKFGHKNDRKNLLSCQSAIHAYILLQYRRTKERNKENQDKNSHHHQFHLRSYRIKFKMSNFITNTCTCVSSNISKVMLHVLHALCKYTCQDKPQTSCYHYTRITD